MLVAEERVLTNRGVPRRHYYYYRGCKLGACRRQALGLLRSCIVYLGTLSDSTYLNNLPLGSVRSAGRRPHSRSPNASICAVRIAFHRDQSRYWHTRSPLGRVQAGRTSRRSPLDDLCPSICPLARPPWRTLPRQTSTLSARCWRLMIPETGRCSPELSRSAYVDPAMRIIPYQLTDAVLPQAQNNSIPQVVNEYFEGQDTVHTSFHARTNKRTRR